MANDPWLRFSKDVGLALNGCLLPLRLKHHRLQEGFAVLLGPMALAIQDGDIAPMPQSLLQEVLSHPSSGHSICYEVGS